MLERYAAVRSILNDGGWIYDSAFYLVAELEIERAAARRWLPRALTPTEPAVATVFGAYFPHNTFGSVYREAGIFLHVRRGRGEAIFSPWMIVDDDVALVFGRELLGYPKKIGEIEFTQENEAIRVHASRRGASLLTMQGTLGDRIADPPPVIGRPHRNVRTLLGPSLPHVIAFTPREEPIEVRAAELQVTIGHSDRDPLRDLVPEVRVRAARLHHVRIGGGGFPLPLRPVAPQFVLRHFALRNL